MSVKLNLLRKLVRELIKKELEEASMTGNIDGGAGPPKTPKAFKKKKKGQDESGFQDGHADPTVSTSYRKVKDEDAQDMIESVESITINGKKYKRLNENNQSWAKYYTWRNDKSMTPKQKIGMSMREVRDSLQELEKIVFRSIKLKKELKVGSDNYWKSTHSALRRIHERLVKLTGKIASLY